MFGLEKLRFPRVIPLCAAGCNMSIFQTSLQCLTAALLQIKRTLRIQHNRSAVKLMQNFLTASLKLLRQTTRNRSSTSFISGILFTGT